MILDPVNASQQSKKEQEALQQRSERDQEEYTVRVDHEIHDLLIIVSRSRLFTKFNSFTHAHE